jgi:hypothetical protein
MPVGVNVAEIASDWQSPRDSIKSCTSPFRGGRYHCGDGCGAEHPGTGIERVSHNGNETHCR